MTYHVARLGRETATNFILANGAVGHQAEAHSVTVDNIGHAIGNGEHGLWRSRIVAPLFRDMLVAGTVDTAAKKLTFPRDTLTQFDTRTSGWLNGAALRVYRVVNGALTEVGETTITQTSAKILWTLHSSGQMIPASQSSFVWSPPGWTKSDMTIHVAVAAINSAGERGPWSTPVPYTFGGQAVASQQASGLVTAPKSFTDQPVNTALGTPGGVTATGLNNGMTIQVGFTGVAGAAGHVVGFSYHPEFMADEHIIVADASFIQTGDLLVYSKRFGHDTVKADVISPRVWMNWPSLGPFGVPRTAPFQEQMRPGHGFAFMSEDGEDFVRFTVPAGASFSIEAVTHAGSGTNGFYSILTPGTYRPSATVRANAATTGTISMAGLSGNGAVNIGTSWSTVGADLTLAAEQTGTALYSTKLTVTGPITIDFKNGQIAKSGEPFLGFDSTTRARLLAAAPMFVRHHGFCKTRPSTYSMKDALSPRGTRQIKSNSIPQFLSLLKEARAANGGVGMNPWLQIEGHMSDIELRQFGGFMCTVYNAADPDSPEKQGAAMRVAAGQTAPWISEFDQIMVECGNENWNPLPEFYVLPNITGAGGAQLNGLMLDRLAGKIMAAPGYNASKFRYYLGGRGNNAFGWNTNTVPASVHADVFGYADYNGGWDSGLSAALQAGDPSAVFYTLANSNMPQSADQKTRHQRMAELVSLCAAASVGRAKPIRAMQYEAGPGYALNGLNGAAVTDEQMQGQERLMKSVAAGTATLDAFLLNTALGVVSSNFFTMGHGMTWNSHSLPIHGGQPNAPFQWVGFINKHLMGETQRLAPMAVEGLNDPTGAARGDAIRVYQIRRPDGRRAYAMVNLDPAATRDIKLSVQSARGWTRHHMTGDLNTYNITAATADAVSIAAERMPSGWGENQMVVSLPPGKAEVYIENAT